MNTTVGIVRLWDEDINGYIEGDLEIDNYVLKLTHNEYLTEITLAEGIEYVVEVERDYSYKVFIKRSNGKIILILDIVGRRKERLYLIESHFDKLNQLSKDKQDRFLKSFENKYDFAVKQPKVRQMLYNFIEKNNKIVFLDYSYMICFERVLFSNYKLGFQVLQISDDTFKHLLIFNSVIEDFEQEVDINILVNYYEEYFTKLVKVLDKWLQFKTEEQGVYVTWKLLLHEINHYYFNVFNDEYSNYIHRIERLSLNECIQSYANIDLIDIGSVSNSSIITYYLMYKRKFDDNENFLKCNKIVVNVLLKLIKNKEIDNFESSLLESPKIDSYRIDDIDLMTGHEFEEFVAYLFSKMGYSTKVTKGSGDQGIDIIAKKNGREFGIQSKCYSNSVTNKAIQEVVAGLKYYNLDKGIVVTNNYFTESAKELAVSNNVILWDRNILKEKIIEFL